MKISRFSLKMGDLPASAQSLLTRTIASALVAAGMFGMTVSGVAHAASSARHAQSACHYCGTVISTHTVKNPAAKGSGVGIASGAVIGGLLGNQIGGGNGRTLATVAGAVGGGYAGNEVEKRVNSRIVTEVRVRMADGSVHTFSEPGNSRWHSGQRVRVANGALSAR